MEMTLEEKNKLLELKIFAYKRAFEILQDAYRCMNNPVARHALSEAKAVIKANKLKEKSYRPLFLGGENFTYVEKDL